jgi:Matrixin
MHSVDRRLRSAAFPVALVALLAGEGRASAYCRTLTADVPASQQPSGDDCYPSGTQGALLYWGNACVGWSMQQSASSKVDVASATKIVEGAFATWANAACSAGGKPSIAFTNNGPVACTEVGFDSTGRNQHVIAFRDSTWPYAGQANATLALTTLTYNKRTGEIVDADMEVNTAEMKITTTATPPADGYDFQSIVTHEVGHFIGLAHTPVATATMFARYSPGQTTIRALSPDDVSGVCEVYRPNGDRAVSATAAASGFIAGKSCDAAPFGGFSSSCDASSGGDASTATTGAKRRCSYGPASPRTSPSSLFALVTPLALAFARRRRRP